MLKPSAVAVHVYVHAYIQRMSLRIRCLQCLQSIAKPWSFTIPSSLFTRVIKSLAGVRDSVGDGKRCDEPLCSLWPVLHEDVITPLFLQSSKGLEYVQDHHRIWIYIFSITSSVSSQVDTLCLIQSHLSLKFFAASPIQYKWMEFQLVALTILNNHN